MRGRGNLTVLNDPEDIVVKVVPPHVEKEPEEGVEEGAEPEVIGEEKEEGEGEAEGATPPPAGEAEAPSEEKK